MIVNFTDRNKTVELKIAFIKDLDMFICKNMTEDVFIASNENSMVLHFGACYMNGGLPVNQAREAMTNPATIEEAVKEFSELTNFAEAFGIFSSKS